MGAQYTINGVGAELISIKTGGCENKKNREKKINIVKQRQGKEVFDTYMKV